MPYGSISKVGSKSRVCFDYGKDEADKRIRKYKTYDTKREAELQMARHSVSMEDGTAIIPRVMTLKEWLTYWLGNIYAVRSAETSVYGYRNMIDRHIVPALWNIRLQKLKPMHIQKYYTLLMSEKELLPNTVIKHHGLLNTALKAAVKQEYLSRNPLEGVERPKKIKHKVITYLSSLSAENISVEDISWVMSIRLLISIIELKAKTYLWI